MMQANSAVKKTETLDAHARGPAAYGASRSSHDDLEEKVAALFSPSDKVLSDEQEHDARAAAIAHAFLRETGINSASDLRALREKFSESTIPDGPADVGDYLNYLSDNVVAHSTHTSSPRFIGHMTSALPYFMRPVGKLLTAMNQNVVKVETAKALTPYERQSIAMMHRLIYRASEEFYRRHIQHGESTLGMLVSGGTLANITALWCARNACFGPSGDFAGVEAEGLAAALSHYGKKEAVIVGSALMHYSFDKAAGLLGVGTRNLKRVPVDGHKRIDLRALRQVLADCRSRGQHVLALVGIAGTTDTGAIDPLAEMADIAREAGIHFHVDAAWGGAVLFSERHRPRLAGIELADSVTIDAHKQLYAPMGLGMVLLRDPHAARVIEKQARYIVRAGSADLGRRSLEGSRPAMALFLHAALNLIGRRGYGFLINEGVRKALYMAEAVRARPEFELLVRPEINILAYRYLPPELRDKAAAGLLTEADDEAINHLNKELQRSQRKAGRSFVSRTMLDTDRSGKTVSLVALRAVLANPLTRESDIDAVLDEQVELAAALTQQGSPLS